MRCAPDFEGLLSVILAEGKGCECLQQHTCPYSGDEWCHRIVREDSGIRILEHERPNAARCLYRDRPGCCWVLAAVETLAADYLARQGVQRPPVASELITAFDESRKIEVRLVPLKALHGAIWLLGREWVIQLNARESRRAKRYTMFHEAFHIAYRNACLAFKEVKPSHGLFTEVLADHFATCFLMPKGWVEEQWPTVQDVRTMAGIFDVPISAMRRRLNQFSLAGKRKDVGVFPDRHRRP